MTLACADYLAGSKTLTFGSSEFCSTKCFESSHDFTQKCAKSMTNAQGDGLAAVIPYIQECAAHLVSNNDGSGHTHAVCPIDVVRQALATACGTAGGLDDCKTRCSKVVHDLSTVCKQEPAFAGYVQYQATCKGSHEDKDCKAVGDHFAQIFQKNCCGSEECKKDLPKTCSAPCSNVFMPFFARCGRANYGDDLARLGNMEKFAETCAQTQGRTVGKGPDANDPCSATSQCSACDGKCGWCRDELTKNQLVSFTPCIHTYTHRLCKHSSIKQTFNWQIGHDAGYCSSKCITTKGECSTAH